MILGTTVAVTAGLVALFGSVCVTRIFSPFTAAVSKVTDHVPSETVVVLTVPSGRVTVIVEPFSPLPVTVVASSTMASTNASLDGTSPEFPTTVALISLLSILLTSFCRAEILCPFTSGVVVSTVHVPSVATSAVFTAPFGSVTVTVAPATPLPLIALEPSCASVMTGILERDSTTFNTNVSLASADPNSLLLRAIKVNTIRPVFVGVPVIV